MEGVEDGILLINKAEGKTSHDVVQKVRRILGVNKVGHAGTLDPFATGLLVILVGQGTKLSEFLRPLAKTYEAVVRLGIETDTYDRTGKIIRKAGEIRITEDDVQSAVRGFLGEIEQIPPPFSAIKIKGKRAYQLARKGKEVNLAPRKVTIYEIVLDHMELPFVGIKVRCSAGTYVRSLAFDLGRKLGCGAYLDKLRRTQVGQFRVDEAIGSEKLERLGKAYLGTKMMSLVEALGNITSVEITKGLAGKVRNGYCPRNDEIGCGDSRSSISGKLIKLVCDKRLVAIASVKESTRKAGERILQLERVFS